MIGASNGVKEQFGLSGDVDATGPLDIKEWPYRLNELGIGIAPLADTRFNAAKSWLKPLEYAALGIPSVVSDRREYRRLNAKTGIGVIASRPRDWYRQISRLIVDASYRQSLGAANRDAALQMEYSKIAWRWMEAWQEAAKLR